MLLFNQCFTATIVACCHRETEECVLSVLQSAMRDTVPFSGLWSDIIAIVHLEYQVVISAKRWCLVTTNEEVAVEGCMLRVGLLFCDFLASSYAQISGTFELSNDATTKVFLVECHTGPCLTLVLAVYYSTVVFCHALGAAVGACRVRFCKKPR